MSTTKVHSLLAGTALCLLAAIAAPAQAQTYPPQGRPIDIIVPYPPGGGTDTAARMMAAGLEKELHATVQVINRPGAASQVGMTALVQSKPDGLTIAYAVLPAVITSYLDPRRRAIYTRKSFAPIATHYIASMMLAVRANSPYKDLKDLVAAARKSPGEINVSDSGLLGTPNLTTLELGHVAGVRFSSVHFPGGPPSVTALLGGQVQVLAGGISDGLPYMRAGKFRILGVAADKPDPDMPNVPTMRSQGYNVVSAAIGAIVAPSGTPPSIIHTLTVAVKNVVDDPAQAAKLQAFGSVPYYNDPAATEKLWADMEQRVSPLLATITKK